MFEELTHENMLEHAIYQAKAITNVDTTEGSFLNTALSVQAFELALAYSVIDRIYERTFADTCPREELIRRCKERGISPILATKSVCSGEFNIEVPIGARFSLYDLTYTVTEVIGDNKYKLECETAGTIGNRYTGNMTPLEYIEGLTSSVLTEVLIPANDEEDTEVLRERYFSSFNSQSFGGNRQYYIDKIKSIQGVGEVKIKRRQAEGTHILVTMIDSDFNIPSDSLIDKVQSEIDPVTNQGDGVGVAPFGHVVNVQGVEGVTIDIQTTLTLDTGISLSDVQASVENAINEYLLGLRQEWSKNDKLTIRIAQIEAKILNIEGILDISDTSINGNMENLVLDEYQVPVIGGVNAI